MNLAWTLRRALLDCNLVRSNGTTPNIISQEDLVSWAQDAVNELVQLWVRSGSDQNLTTRTSEDSAFIFQGQSFSPSGLQLLTTTLDYTLPPDLLRLKRIRITDAARRHYVLTHMDISNPVFRSLNQEWSTTTNPTSQEIYYDVVGRRTLHLSHTPPASSHIEIVYQAALPQQYIYNGVASNTAALTLNDATVDFTGGAGTLFSDNRLTTPASIIFTSGGGTTHPVIVTQTADTEVVTPNATGLGNAFPISSYTDDDTLELSAVWPFATDASIGYIIASAPWMLEQHYQTVILYLQHKIYGRMGNTRAADKKLAEWGAGKQIFSYDTKIRAEELEFVHDWEG